MNYRYYSTIVFDKKVTFWLQRVRSLPCACAYVALFARRLAHNHYAIAYAYSAANTHAQGSDRARLNQKVEGNRTIESILINFQVLYLLFTLFYTPVQGCQRRGLPSELGYFEIASAGQKTVGREV